LQSRAELRSLPRTHDAISSGYDHGTPIAGVAEHLIYQPAGLSRQLPALEDLYDIPQTQSLES
jgi:hypothetical protein